MLLKSSRHHVVGLALFCFGLLPSRAAEAGPLLDWLFGRSNAPPAYAVGSPVAVGNGYAAGYAPYAGAANVGVAPGVAAQPYNAGAVANYGAAYAPNGYGAGYVPNGNGAVSPYGGYAANYGTYYSSQLPVIGPAGNGYTAPQVGGAAAATMPPTVSYVPNYRTNSYRAPVTYYRPLLTTDPNTSAQVVAMAPCTSYEYQAQRVPTLGRSSLFGSYGPPAAAPAPTAPPTYTLPSGGIPLAYSPSQLGPTVRGYGGYSTLQPPTTDLTAPPIGAYQQPGNYSTSPLGTQPYYGSTSGGSCGGSTFNPVPPTSVPGLMAPQGPSTISPSDSYSPGGVYPDQNDFSPPPSFPGGSNAPSSGFDPADVPPSLPSMGTSSRSFGADDVQATNNYRPKLRSIYREPRDDSQSISRSPTRASSASPSSSDPRLDAPTPSMMPLPGPQDQDMRPRWNPGLLSDEDKTALRPIPREPIRQEALQVAGQSKPIRWASFQADRHSENVASASYEGARDNESAAGFDKGLQLSGSTRAGRPDRVQRLRPIESNAASGTRPATTEDGFRPWPSASRAPVDSARGNSTGDYSSVGAPSTATKNLRILPPSSPVDRTNRSPYDTNGWKAAR